MRTDRPGRATWPRKLGVLILVLPLVIVVAGKNPDAAGAVVAAGGRLLGWCADAIARLLGELTT
ncbi:hypothetical protein [Microbispora amethystogenes]|uniref:Uncharacterized protein n=1 Tax=Microbispora amethystogenes TaxID=1427754 RepID=A0ABQ4FE57_9ACTN|nr:hypothetical protein [Microbispora amethystogenes]GIH33107.1 hypothetical protein Mam01_32710 [Microbispora amethystogenes]